MTTATATRRGTTKRRRPPVSPADPVTSYATAVLEGAVIAGRAVRLACQRHLADLERQRTAAFPYYFDVAAAHRIIDFFPTFLTLENGDPFVLPPWLQFCDGSLYGWKVWGGDRQTPVAPEMQRRAGKRRFIYGFHETSKGSGKSPAAAGKGLYAVAGFDDEPYGQIYSCAYDKGQASIILNDAIRMARASEDLNAEYGGLLTIGTYNISNEADGSFFRAVSQETRGKSGPRPSMVLGDEIHEMRDGGVLNRLTAGFKFRTQPQALLYTNSGSDRTSLCWEYHQKSLAVLDGTQPDEQWFAYVCHLDPCEKCAADGYRQPKDGCPDCDDWRDPSVWPKVAPALGIVIQPKYQQDAVDMALSVASEYALKRRLNFCIWTESHQVWITPDRWSACQVPTVSDGNPKGLVCAAGLDLADKIDLASLVVALRHDDEPTGETAAPEVVEIEGKDEAGVAVTQRITLNFSVELIPWFWLPHETLLERVKQERIPFDVWEREGYLTVTPGGVIDHEAIYDHIVKTVWPRYRVQQLGYDERSATMLAVALRDRAKLNDAVMAVGQGKKLSEAFKLMEVLIRSRRLRHNGHPVLAWNFANAEPHRDRLGALWIEKPQDIKRIDGVIATAMAISRLMVAQAPKTSVYARGRHASAIWGGAKV